MKKKTEEEIELYVIIILMISSVLGLIYFTEGFNIGLRNSDLGQNMVRLNEAYGLNLKDIASDFNDYSGEELYINGVNITRISFYGAIGSALIFGVSIAFLIMRGERKR